MGFARKPAPSESGIASCAVNTAFMIGGALGLGLLASVAAARSNSLLASRADPITALNGGYPLAFLLGAVFALGAAALASALLRAGGRSGSAEVAGFCGQPDAAAGPRPETSQADRFQCINATSGGRDPGPWPRCRRLNCAGAMKICHENALRPCLGDPADLGRVSPRASRLPAKDVAVMSPQPGQAGANALPGLLQQVRACTICAAQLPLGPRPVLQLAASARILIAAQAPGRKVHESGLPFDDASGVRLRQWLGINREPFYDARTIAILPMGFCFPGSGKSGDLPPRPECAAHWRAQLLASLPHIELILVIGRYAQDWHLPGSRKSSLTDTVKAWRTQWPRVLPLPHPSPRNNIWLSKNPWFALEVVPLLQARVASVLGLG